MHAAHDENSSPVARTATTRWTVSQRYRDWSTIVVTGTVLFLVVPLMVEVPAAAAFAALNALSGLLFIRGPRGWRAAFLGERDPLWPIQRYWVRIVPIGSLATLVLGALSLV